MYFNEILLAAVSITGVLTLYNWFSRRRVILQEDKSVHTRSPLIFEYARSFFPVLMIVFVIRSFLVEPFQIPSGSMLPSLHIGDFILVNKFHYGIRLPVLNLKVIDNDKPDRGDVLVFRYPEDPSINFIKRVVGIPGDKLLYTNKQLFINDQPVKLKKDQSAKLHQSYGGNVFTESLRPDGSHQIMLHQDSGSGNFSRTVPENSYFVLGDNRDRSNDSRYWGFVPEANIVGKAFFIWFSWDDDYPFNINWGRIGQSIH